MGAKTLWESLEFIAKSYLSSYYPLTVDEPRISWLWNLANSLADFTNVQASVNIKRININWDNKIKINIENFWISKNILITV